MVDHLVKLLESMLEPFQEKKGAFDVIFVLDLHNSINLSSILFEKVVNVILSHDEHHSLA